MRELNDWLALSLFTTLPLKLRLIMRRPIRILHLRASNFLGGPERQVLQYAEYERKGPAELIIGTLLGETEGREFARSAEARGLQVFALPSERCGDIGALRRSVAYLREQAVRLICTHGYQADVLGTIAGRLTGVPVACFLRGWTGEDWKVRIYEGLDRALLPLANRVVCLSHTQAKQLALRNCLAMKVRVVCNAVEARSITSHYRSEARRMLRSRLGLPAESIVVATAGRLSPEKGTAHFLESIRSIVHTFPKAHCVVFGNGPMRVELEKRARQLDLAPNIHFAGFVPSLADLLPGIDVIVNPSLSEVMPNVVLESMAAAIPVVATDVGGVAEIAGQKKALALVPARDSMAISSAVSELLHDPAYAAELGRVGQRRVLDAFSPSIQKSQLRALYRELIPELQEQEFEVNKREAGSKPVSDRVACV